MGLKGWYHFGWVGGVDYYGVFARGVGDQVGIIVGAADPWVCGDGVRGVSVGRGERKDGDWTAYTWVEIGYAWRGLDWAVLVRIYW